MEVAHCGTDGERSGAIDQRERVVNTAAACPVIEPSPAGEIGHVEFARAERILEKRAVQS